jgi:hypothetical protein
LHFKQTHKPNFDILPTLKDEEFMQYQIPNGCPGNEKTYAVIASEAKQSIQRPAP